MVNQQLVDYINQNKNNYSINSFNLMTACFKLSIAGKEVLNKSPEIKIKSTFFSMHKSTAFMKAFVLTSLSLGSLQLPIWQSARCANFICSQTEENSIKIYKGCFYGRKIKSYLNNLNNN